MKVEERISKQKSLDAASEWNTLQSILHRLNKRSPDGRCDAGDETEEMQPEIRLAIARIGVSDPSSLVRNQAAQTLAEIGTSLDAFRVKMLTKDPDWVVRSSAVDAVWRVLGKRGESLLCSKLNDVHCIVRRDAAIGLLDLELESSIGCLHERLRIEKHEQALLGLWQALIFFGEREHLPKILLLWHSETKGIRSMVWYAVLEVVDMGPLNSQEVELIRGTMNVAFENNPSPAALDPLNELKEKLAELYP